jgi:hypothetical protein
MGGFLYCAKKADTHSNASLSRSLEVFEKKQLSDGRLLSLKEVIEKPDFVIYLYEKIGLVSENVCHLENGDFILNTGTIIYKHKTGRSGLKKLYADFDPAAFQFDCLQGQFCVLVYKNNRLYIWNDLFGVYHVFTNEDRSLISSSFLAVVRQQKSRQIDLQAMYEYVLEGASYNDGSYIKGVKLLDAFRIHELSTDSPVLVKQHSLEKNQTDNFEERIELTVDSLITYFKALKSGFGSNVCSALSGGYDSRLILALLIEVGMDPYLYVYGGRQSADVRIASAIAAAEGLEIHHDNRIVKKPSLEEFRELIQREYFYCDGHGPNGVFSNGAEFNARTIRSNAADLQLNGAGGEIFRNFWKLPDRAITIQDFLKSRFDRLPAATFKTGFNKQKYLSKLETKIQHMLAIDHNVMTVNEVAKLYVYMRIKYWMGYNTSIQNVRSYALIPLSEPVFAVPSFSIPFRQKEAGEFEAALIRRLNPKLAAYDSAYGYNFSDKPPLAALIKNSLVTNLPVTAQRLLRKGKYRLSSNSKPYYLHRDFLDTVAGVDGSFIDEYFNLENIRDPLMLSRLHTINLVLTDPF